MIYSVISVIFGIFVISGILNDLISDIKKAGVGPAEYLFFIIFQKMHDDISVIYKENYLYN